ncbi:MAG: phosphoribosylaminoimidazolesuccinocarboxamide synthase [Bacteroidales bacterium]|nr:phosphoribosylaminoimidazolesuccinocarboxamide synthase [Bacteroidales bacterium]MCR5276265.1 phosphoribosylaminoimidazolesuccinocarboxamide synthase [Bacteroidales bacterium]
MEKREIIFEGNEKQVFATDDQDQVIFRYKDVTVAYNNVKRARFKGKGALDNQISAILLSYLNEHGVETHYIETLGEQEQLCRKIEIIPLQVVVHNRIAGSLAYRLGVPEGFRHENVIVDLRYNNDELEDPFINRDHAVALGLATYQELDRMYDIARRVNELLKPLFLQAGIELIDMKLEFGRASDSGAIIISDEISPDTCRLWDLETGERMDKDRFRLDLSRVVENYRNVLERLQKVIKS